MKLFISLISTLIFLALVGCTTSREELAAQVDIAMQEKIQLEFSQLKFEEKQDTSEPSPNLVFTGKTSMLLAVLTKPHLSGKFDPDMTMSGIARTNNGRYFYFEYTSKLYDQERLMEPRWGEKPCLSPSCRTFSGRMISAEKAKHYIFSSEGFTAVRYKEIFGEEAPPKEIAA
jgi:hypothetical protein